MFDGRHHILRVRVYYEDTDAAGIVYHAGYLRFAERGRTEFLRELGWQQAALAAGAGLAFAVRQARIDWRAPARLDDELAVRTSLSRLGGASLEVVQQVSRGDLLLALLEVKVACVGRDLRPARLPGPLRRALTQLLPNSERIAALIPRE